MKEGEKEVTQQYHEANRCYAVHIYSFVVFIVSLHYLFTLYEQYVQ